MTDASADPNLVIVPEALLQAYAAAAYRVETSAGAVVVRIGQSLEGHSTLPPFDRFAIVTAYNPFSELLGEVENAERQRDLLELVEVDGLRWLPAAGSDPTGEWPAEPSLAIFDPTDAQLDHWMEAFDQNAVVVCERGGLAQLHFHPRSNRRQKPR